MYDAITDLANNPPATRGMLWLEVTNGCNLQCSHCYSDSFPGSGMRDTVSHSSYLRLLDEAADCKISTVQFIGGEPMIYKRLPDLVSYAQGLGFERVEIFSNLTVPRPDVLAVIDPRITTVATSVYSAVPRTHERITRKLGSFSRTLANVRKCVERGIIVRAGFIEMDENVGEHQSTSNFWMGLGVASVGFDRVRAFGRGAQAGCDQLSELCGSCSGNTLCVTYDGKVLPCIMSRSWPLGDIAHESLFQISTADSTRRVRESIRAATLQKATRSESSGADNDVQNCTPNACQPTQSDCIPKCHPGCAPGQGCTPCGPQGSQPCYPTDRCNPIGCGSSF